MIVDLENMHSYDSRPLTVFARGSELLGIQEKQRSAVRRFLEDNECNDAYVIFGSFLLRSFEPGISRISTS